MEHWRFIGDQLDTRENIKRAERELNIHRDLVRLGNLSQYKTKREFGDGLVVECKTVFKDEIIKVFKSGKGERKNIIFSKDYSIVPVIYVYDSSFNHVGYYIARNFVSQVFKSVNRYYEKTSSDLIRIGTYFKYGLTNHEIGAVVELEDIGDDLLEISTDTETSNSITQTPEYQELTDMEGWVFSLGYPVANESWPQEWIDYQGDYEGVFGTWTIYYPTVGYGLMIHHNAYNSRPYEGQSGQLVGIFADNGIDWGYVTLTKDSTYTNNLIHTETEEVIRCIGTYNSNTTRTLGIGGTFSPLERSTDAVTINTGYLYYDSSSSYNEESGKFICLLYYIDDNGTFEEHTDINDVKLTGGTTTAYASEVSPEQTPKYLDVYLDDGTVYNVYYSEISDDEWFMTSCDVFKVNDASIVYMYSAFSNYHKQMTYGFIFQGKHHRLVFNNAEYDLTYYPKSWCNHSFESALYIGPDNKEQVVEFPEAMRDKKGSLNIDRDFTACKTLNNVKVEEI